MVQTKTYKIALARQRRNKKLCQKAFKKIKRLEPKSLVFKFTTVVLLFAFTLSFGNVGLTKAFYNDVEIFSDNSFGAATLLIESEPQILNLPEIGPGTVSSGSLNILNLGGLPFEYKIFVEEIITDGGLSSPLCSALNLIAEKNGEEIWNGSLLNLDTATSTLLTSGKDVLDIYFSLPADASPEISNLGCSVKFIFAAWQIGFHRQIAFFHEASSTVNISAGPWSADVPYVGAYSPIADAYVNQDKPNDNKGSAFDLYIQSHENKNNRTFVKFDFVFPSEALIHSANLKLYMSDQPSESRIFEAYKVLNSWLEKGITWNNQPGVSDEPTDSIQSGTNPGVWLSWDVTDDMYGFNFHPENNHGWRISDASENNANNINSKFVSRDSNEQDKRPQLEVVFSAPPANTDHIVVNEVYYDVGSSEGSDSNNEWVELYNPTDNEIDISGWKICDNSGCDFIASNTLPAKGFAVITNKDTTWNFWPNIPSEAVKIVLDSPIGSGLNNTGDKITLQKPSLEPGIFETVDEMSYGDNTTVFDPAVPDPGEGKSLARIIKGYDSNTADDWIINATPNPGTNPASDGLEKIIFTSDGVMISSAEIISNNLPLPIEQPEPPETNDLLLPATLSEEIVVSSTTETETEIEQIIENEPVIIPESELETEILSEPISEPIKEPESAIVEESQLPSEPTGAEPKPETIISE